MVKGGGKIGWFALAPIVLSVIASALISGRVTLGSVVTVAGTLAIMIFNGVKAYATAFSDVADGGVARNAMIVRIIETTQRSVIPEATDETTKEE